MKYQLTVGTDSYQNIKLIATAVESLDMEDGPFYFPWVPDIHTVIDRIIDNILETGSHDGYEGWLLLADGLEEYAHKLRENVPD